MRVCLLSTTYPPVDTEGISRQRQTLALALAKKGHEVHVITCGSVGYSRRVQGVWIHEVPVTRVYPYSDRYPGLDIPLTYSQALYEELTRLNEERRVDVVDVPLWSAQGFTTLHRYRGSVVLWLQTTRTQLFAINGRYPTRDDRALLAIERLCLQKAAGVLADSQAALASVARDYHVKLTVPTEVAYLGLPSWTDTYDRQASAGHVEALVVGRLERRKGTPFLFEVMPNLLRRLPQLSVRFIGRDNSADDGWRRHHHATYPEYFQKRHPDLVQRVTFEGYVDETRLALCYRQADFVLVPSLYESFGLVYLEAMRAALPVVAFLAGAAEEIYAPGEADGAFLVPPEDSARFAEAVQRLVQDSNLRRRLGQNGLRRFTNAFTAEQMADTTLAFYEQVTNHSAAAK